jgi:hypothetical protein
MAIWFDISRLPVKRLITFLIRGPQQLGIDPAFEEAAHNGALAAIMRASGRTLEGLRTDQTAPHAHQNTICYLQCPGGAQ